MHARRKLDDLLGRSAFGRDLPKIGLRAIVAGLLVACVQSRGVNERLTVWRECVTAPTRERGTDRLHFPGLKIVPGEAVILPLCLEDAEQSLAAGMKL